MTDPDKPKVSVGDSLNGYREVFECLPCWVWLTDKEGIITYSSHGITDVLDCKPSEILGTRLLDLVGEENVSIIRDLFQPTTEGKRHGKCVVVHLHRTDGTKQAIELISNPVFDPEGQLTGFIGLGREVTKQIAEAEGTRETLANYKALTDNSPTGIIIVQNEKVVYANPYILRLMGYKGENALGSKVWNFVHPDDRDRVQEFYHRRIAGMEAPEHYDVRVITRQGEVRYFELRATVIQFNGAPAVLDNIIDVTERKLAELAVRESEDRYRRLVDLLPDAIIVTMRGEFVFLNTAGLAMHGASELEEMVGKRVLDFVSPEYREIARARMTALIEGEIQSVPPMHEKFFRLDGTTFDVEVSASRITFRGEPAILAVVRDITERKRAEERQRELERQLEAQKWHFYRETLMSVTDGKLLICEPHEVEEYIAKAQFELLVSIPKDVSEARHKVAQFCEDLGLSEDRLNQFIIAVGEAITNAIKHAHQGRVYAGAIDGSVWVAVADSGPGISSLIIPKATLLRGFSTKPSLGLGYTIMLEVADEILLATGERGTTVILVQSISEQPHLTQPAQLPDTWNNVSAY
ncbi:MAG: PAS domain S-box protein [Armatimonadetes bacterium]|nr:PAS domain S-box protein [Armatimonadota bacterium]